MNRHEAISAGPKSIRPNGWQRIGIIASTAWLLFVSSLAAIELFVEPERKGNREFTEIISRPPRYSAGRSDFAIGQMGKQDAIVPSGAAPAASAVLTFIPVDYDPFADLPDAPAHAETPLAAIQAPSVNLAQTQPRLLIGRFVCVAFGPILAVWLSAYLCLWAVRWIAAGF